ncbi:hypothetical protein HG1285_14289 [Hydrogenivirga sp. 128-5-R1-1]|nr:hypothetical protein HG1285_14289 [Hydrogenivirga sp. 128-5-R1-1]
MNEGVKGKEERDEEAHQASSMAPLEASVTSLEYLLSQELGISFCLGLKFSSLF